MAQSKPLNLPELQSPVCKAGIISRTFRAGMKTACWYGKAGSTVPAACVSRARSVALWLSDPGQVSASYGASA